MDLSVIVPLFNEEESLPELVAWIDRVVKAEKLETEVILVDDGSKDGSWNIIENLQREDLNPLDEARALEQPRHDPGPPPHPPQVRVHDPRDARPVHRPPDRPRLRITIDDDGPGISADRRASALTRGSRLDERRPGSGLGLAIVQELATLYGGSLTLDAATLGGARAVLTLPAAQRPMPAARS